jgi:uracil phosphoribosyltransferase
MADVAYRQSRYRPPEIPHRYGDRVHLLDDPVAWTLLARACSPDVGQPELGRLVSLLYASLVQAVLSAELPRERAASKTRMAVQHPEHAVYRGIAVARETKVVSVGIARAGTLPSQVTYELLNTLFDPAGVRQDHLSMSRVTNEHGAVTGVVWHDAKIGRDVADRFVLFPDPMGATGSSIVSAMKHYLEALDGRPRLCIAVHLIVTPEYLRHVTSELPEAVVYALRLDRGLSALDVLEQIPGERWPEERGLNEQQYIVPGAGGVGELLNNAWV